MADIISALQELGELEYWTRCPIQDAVGDALAYPPVIVWRYKRASPALANLIRKAIADFPGAIGWEFNVAERNWVLMPARINEFARANDLLGDVPAAKELKAKDPEFGKRANAELLLLAEHLAKAAEKVTVS